MQSSQMQTIVEKWSSMNIALIGIGRMLGIERHQKKNITKETLSLAHADPNYPVCNICARQFNIFGEEIESLSTNLVSVPTADLNKVEDVIAIACGKHKALSIIAALRSKIIKTLIIDEQTAKSVIEYAELIENKYTNDRVSKKQDATSVINNVMLKELMDGYGVRSPDDIQSFINAVASKAINEALNTMNT